MPGLGFFQAWSPLTVRGERAITHNTKAFFNLHVIVCILKNAPVSYRKRENPIVKVCQQCRTDFATWHVSRIYCGQACNMTAWRHRHKLSLSKLVPLQKALPAKVLPARPLSALDKLSIPGALNAAAGTLVADGVKALFDNQPTIADLVNVMKSFDQRLGYSIGSLETRLKALQDHDQAVEQADFLLAGRVSLIRKRRGKNHI